MQRIRLTLSTLMVSSLLAGTAARAQTVTGRVVDAGSREPVAGALVLLRGEDGAELRTVADRAGGYTIRAHGPGTYTLLAERVGYRSSPPESVRLAAGETVRHDLRAGAGRVMLAAVTATGRPRACSGNVGRGPEAQVLWEEARKVLAASVLGGEGEQVEFITRMYRHLEVLPSPAPRQRREWTLTARGRPFVVRSVDDLLAKGYVEPGPDSTVFHAVDAQTILSDAFVQHHCFSVREGGRGRPGLVGLEFMPLRGLARPDVEGVLWLDRATAELRRVEYRYTGVGYSGPMERLGGRMSFARLPNGGWIVRDWVVNAPLLDNRVTRDIRARPRVRGTVVTGGEVMEIRVPGQAPVAPAAVEESQRR